MRSITKKPLFLDSMGLIYMKLRCVSFIAAQNTTVTGYPRDAGFLCHRVVTLSAAI
jgi:hypothetical protein